MARVSSVLLHGPSVTISCSQFVRPPVLCPCCPRRLFTSVFRLSLAFLEPVISSQVVVYLCHLLAIAAANLFSVEYVRLNFGTMSDVP